MSTGEPVDVPEPELAEEPDFAEESDSVQADSVQGGEEQEAASSCTSACCKCCLTIQAMRSTDMAHAAVTRLSSISAA